MKTIESALAVIRNSGRILLTWDDDGHMCSWWTLDEMLADEHMRRVNDDLIGTLELIETGLLPVPSVDV